MKYIKLFEEISDQELRKAIDFLKYSKGKEMVPKVSDESGAPENPNKQEDETDIKNWGDYESTQIKGVNVPYPKPDEDLNIPRMERQYMVDGIIKNYRHSYKEIARRLGMVNRTFFRKMKEYELDELRSQIRERKGKGWDHPYDTIKID